MSFEPWDSIEVTLGRNCPDEAVEDACGHLVIVQLAYALAIDEDGLRSILF